MRATGVNMTDVKQINRSYVLQLLFSKGAMSRTDLASAMHLTTATLTSICNDFLRRGLLVQLDKTDTQLAGRKRYPLAINATYKYVVAISLHYTGHLLAITDLRGKAIALRHMEAWEGADPEAFFHSVADQCIRMLWEQQIPAQSVLGAGVCIIGAVDHLRGVALHPFKIFDEINVPVRTLLERELPFPVCVESNVCSFLTAETLMGNAVGNDLLAIKWGPGVGSASSVNGVLCKDSKFRSAEVGHTLHYLDSGQLCKCGRTGCLETGVSLSRIAEIITQLAESDESLREALDRLGLPTIHNILDFLALNHPALMAFVDHCARDLAVAVNNAIQVFQPDQVLLCGVLFESDYVLGCFLNHIHAIDPSYQDELFYRSQLEDCLEYIGPAAIAVKTFLLDTGGEIV